MPIAYRHLQSAALRHWCRSCINETFELDLQPQHCVYREFPAQCKHCREVCNIVDDVRILSRWRLLLTVRQNP